MLLFSSVGRCERIGRRFKICDVNDAEIHSFIRWHASFISGTVRFRFIHNSANPSECEHLLCAHGIHRCFQRVANRNNWQAHVSAILLIKIGQRYEIDNA